MTCGFHTWFSSGPVCCSCPSPLCFSATATTTGITKISSAKLAKNASSKERKHGICSFSRHAWKAAILVPLLSESRWSFITLCHQFDKRETLILLWSPNLIQKLHFIRGQSAQIAWGQTLDLKCPCGMQETTSIPVCSDHRPVFVIPREGLQIRRVCYTWSTSTFQILI